VSNGIALFVIPEEEEASRIKFKIKFVHIVLFFIVENVVDSRYLYFFLMCGVQCATFLLFHHVEYYELIHIAVIFLYNHANF
jgi:hypothetical protein